MKEKIGLLQGQSGEGSFGELSPPFKGISVEDLQKMSDFALKVRGHYALKEEERGIKWDQRDHGMGFVGDYGNLAYLLLAKSGKIAGVEDVDKRLSHELSDCVWSTFVIANECNIGINKLSAQETYDKDWNTLDLGQCFAIHLGQVMKLIQAKEGKRSIENVEQGLSKELSACLGVVLEIAERSGIDLKKSYLENMTDLVDNIVSGEK